IDGDRGAGLRRHRRESEQGHRPAEVESYPQREPFRMDQTVAGRIGYTAESRFWVRSIAGLDTRINPNLLDLLCVCGSGGAVMFVRFVVAEQDEDSHRLTGVFQAAFRLRDQGLLSKAEGSRFEQLRQWFNEHLP